MLQWTHWIADLIQCSTLRVTTSTAMVVLHQQFKPQLKDKLRSRRQDGPLVVAAQTKTQSNEEVIVGIAAGPLLPDEMALQGLGKQSAETAEAYALHEAVKWALAQPEGEWRNVTIFMTAQEQVTQRQAGPHPQRILKV